MKVDEFIKKYSSAKNKDDYLEKCITTQYIPYHEKIADCTNIINSTIEKDGIFKINTPAQFMIFMVQLITKYTDIDKDEDVLGLFEKLDKLDLINGITSKIPKKEFESYNTILGMIQNDYMENNRNIISFLETKLSAIGISIDTLLDGLIEMSNKELTNEAVES